MFLLEGVQGVQGNQDVPAGGGAGGAGGSGCSCWRGYRGCRGIRMFLLESRLGWSCMNRACRSGGGDIESQHGEWGVLLQQAAHSVSFILIPLTPGLLGEWFSMIHPIRGPGEQAAGLS